MKSHTDSEISEMSGSVALPRKSGELVFHDAWERRVFAMAVALCEQGRYPWDEFRDQLIAEISRAEAAARSDGSEIDPSTLPGYYQSWLAAFEQVLIKLDIHPSPS